MYNIICITHVSATTTDSNLSNLGTEGLLELGVLCPSDLTTSRCFIWNPQGQVWSIRGIVSYTSLKQSLTNTCFFALKSSRRFVSAFLAGHVHDSCGAACPKCREQQICEEEVTQIIHLRSAARPQMSRDVQRCPEMSSDHILAVNSLDVNVHIQHVISTPACGSRP